MSFARIAGEQLLQLISEHVNERLSKPLYEELMRRSKLGSDRLVVLERLSREEYDYLRSPEERLILFILRHDGVVEGTMSEVARNAGVHEQTLRSKLPLLERDGLLLIVQRRKGRYGLLLHPKIKED